MKLKLPENITTDNYYEFVKNLKLDIEKNKKKSLEQFGENGEKQKRITSISFFLNNGFEDFSFNIQHYIYMRKLNFRKFAKLIDVSDDVFGRFLKGERIPNFKIIILAASIMGCSVDYLLGLTDSERYISPDNVITGFHIRNSLTKTIEENNSFKKLHIDCNGNTYLYDQEKGLQEFKIPSYLEIVMDYRDKFEDTKEVINNLEDTVYDRILEFSEMNKEFSQTKIASFLEVPKQVYSRGICRRVFPSYKFIYNMSLSMKASIDYILGLTDVKKISEFRQDKCGFHIDCKCSDLLSYFEEPNVLPTVSFDGQFKVFEEPDRKRFKEYTSDIIIRM